MSPSPAPHTGPSPKALGIVPARLGSKRLPRKMLLRETGQFLFEHTVQNALSCGVLDRVVLATDSEEILAAAAEVGIDALPTSADHPSGTDRVHEAWQQLAASGDADWDVVVNIQGDEPELPGRDLEWLVAAFRDPEVEMATLAAPIRKLDEARDPSVVKVVSDTRGDALYFSRSAIPSLEHPSRPMRAGAPGLTGCRRHIGVYAFRPEALTRFCALPAGALEATENLEQLRWLEAGQRMRVIETDEVTTGIDTRPQYEAFLHRVKQHGLLTP